MLRSDLGSCIGVLYRSHDGFGGGLGGRLLVMVLLMAVVVRLGWVGAQGQPLLRRRKVGEDG